MINNFKQIEGLLHFESDDDFYFLQLIKRKKDNPDMEKSEKIVKTYYITSIEHLEGLKGEIILICEYYNARAYINLNKRSFEKCAMHLLKQTTDCIINKEYKSAKNAYNSVCGKFGNSNSYTKFWIIDIDASNDSLFIPLSNQLEKLEPIGNKVIAKIPTKNGYHIITTPFNRHAFDYLFCSWSVIPKPDIHSNNPTILFIP